LPVATPNPPPEPADAAPAPTPTPDPVTSGEPAPVQEEAAEPEETSENVPKGEQEINPGEVAFTDYQPFDLDEIEPEPLQSKWKNFVGGLRGLSRYDLFDGRSEQRQQRQHVGALADRAGHVSACLQKPRTRSPACRPFVEFEITDRG
jgi:hypothetical protein